MFLDVAVDRRTGLDVLDVGDPDLLTICLVAGIITAIVALVIVKLINKNKKGK